MFLRINLILCALGFLCFVTSAQADIWLKWQISGNNANDIALTYKDANHIVISAQADLKFLKLHEDLYLLQAYNGFKVAFNLTKSAKILQKSGLMEQLPNKMVNFWPIMVLDGSTQMVQGHEGDIIRLKDFKKSVTVVSSQNIQHLAIKNALLPMVAELVNHLPNLPNRQLIDVLKHSEFGLPLRIGNRVVLTQSKTIKADEDVYSLKGYKVIGGLKDLIF